MVLCNTKPNEIMKKYWDQIGYLYFKLQELCAVPILFIYHFTGNDLSDL